jgi:hypothetical protein
MVSSRIAGTLGVIGALVLPAAVSAATPPDPIPTAGLAIAAFEDDDGNPSLWSVLDGESTSVHWSTCPADGSSCIPLTSPMDALLPGQTPAGTTFKASFTRTGKTSTVRTPPWQGTVAATTPPTLEGTPVVGATVVPHAGGWSGGWGTDFDGLQVVACPTQVATDCELIAAQGLLPIGNALGSATLDERYVGWYLFAFDARTTAAAASSTLLPPTPGSPSWGTGALSATATVSQSAPLGPIMAAPVVQPPTLQPPTSTPSVVPTPQTITLTPTAGTPQKPVVVLPHSATLLTQGRLRVGRVRCSLRCRVTFSVSDTHNHTVRGAVALAHSSATLTVRRGKLRHGTLRVLVRVNGRRIASGRLRFSR